MDRQILLKKFIQEELNRYQSLYDSLNKQFQKLPKGSITKVAEGQYSRVLRENGKQIKISLGPNDNDLLDELKLRRQIKDALPLLKKKIKLLNSFIKNDILYDPLQLNLPEQYKDVSPKLFLPNDTDPVTWSASTYRKGRFYPNDIRHYTEGGIVTRSKSEAMIGTQLERSGLQFRYEQALNICGEIIFPDFIILHPVTRRLIYWEHLGKISDPDYVKKNLHRLINYAKNGIYLGINLVITYETPDDPLTIKTIARQISEIISLN